MDDVVKSAYVMGKSELSALQNPAAYGWSSAEMACPEGATWYSFSKEYIETHLVSAREIFPDLAQWQEDDG